MRREVREGIFCVRESYRLTGGPGEQAIIEGIDGDGTVGSAGAENEPGVYAMIYHVLNLRSFDTWAMLLKEEENGSSLGNGIHLCRGEHTPTVPIGRSIKRTDVG